MDSNLLLISSGVCVGNQKLASLLKDMKSSNLQYAEVEMRRCTISKSLSKSTSEAQYEECGGRGGVTSSNVAMEDNPAYQSVDGTVAKP